MLRIRHEGCASIRVEKDGATVRVDPVVDVRAEDIVLLTWQESERLLGTERAATDGRRPRVAATDRILAWLRERGEIVGLGSPGIVDGVAFEALPYRPVPYVDVPEAFLKTRSALTHPLRAASRLVRRADLPSSDPVGWHVVFPGGTRVLHLNCALHRWTPDDWVRATAHRLGSADVVLAGVDFGHEDDFERRILAFNPQRLVVADLVGDVRRALGLPSHLLTPLVERLRRRGVDAQVLASGTSLAYA